MTLYSDDEFRFARALESIETGVKISNVAPSQKKLVLGRVTE